MNQESELPRKITNKVSYDGEIDRDYYSIVFYTYKYVESNQDDCSSKIINCILLLVSNVKFELGLYIYIDFCTYKSIYLIYIVFVVCYCFDIPINNRQCKISSRGELSPLERIR